MMLLYVVRELLGCECVRMRFYCSLYCQRGPLKLYWCRAYAID